MKTCAACSHHLPAEHPTPRGQTFHVPTCKHPGCRNQHGPVAITLARSSSGGCGEDGRYWMPHRGPGAA